MLIFALAKSEAPSSCIIQMCRQALIVKPSNSRNLQLNQWPTTALLLVSTKSVFIPKIDCGQFGNHDSPHDTVVSYDVLTLSVRGTTVKYYRREQVLPKSSKNFSCLMLAASYC